MNNETQNTIQKIEESLSRQRDLHEADPSNKMVKTIGALLAIIALVLILITTTGWLTIEQDPAYVNAQVQNR